MLKLKKNLTAGMISCIVGVALWFLIPIGITMKVSTVTNAVGPDYMPKLIAITLVVMGLILVAQSVIFKKDEYVEIRFAQEKMVLLYLLILIAMVVAMPIIGYLPAGLIASVLFFLAFKEKNKVHYAIVLAICVIVYCLFQFLLGIPLP